jgi:hypothetical protein
MAKYQRPLSQKATQTKWQFFVIIYKIWLILASLKNGKTLPQQRCYHILSSIVHTVFIENDTEILPVHYTYKVAFTNLIQNKVFR